MKNKRLILIWIAFSALTAMACADSKQENETLKIYLPRDITVENGTPTLGDIAVIRGEESLISRAGRIPLGKLTTAEQTIVINRTIVLSRLACNGIPTSDVTLTGAEETHIRRKHQLIKGSEFVTEATAFLKDHLPNETICRFEPLRTPEGLTLSDMDKEVKLVCRLIDNGARNQCKVRVIAYQDGKEIGQQEIPFRFRYHCRRVVTKTAITKGDVITKDNVTVENGISDYPEPADWTVPYGLVAARSLPADTELRSNLVRSPKPEVLIKRNQTVTIIIDCGGLLASATGKALENGATGEFIKVQNIDSRVIVMAKVNEDGTVTPVY